METGISKACPLLGFDEDHLMGMELVSVVERPPMNTVAAYRPETTEELPA